MPNLLHAANGWPRPSRAEGIEPGDRVAYLSFNTNKLLEGYYGVVMAGAIVMPLNVRLTTVELINILNHSGAKMLLHENDFAPLAAEIQQVLPRGPQARQSR